MKETTILGAGISGLGVSYHLGHTDCTVFEGSDHYGGHTHSIMRDGFTWDDGPHVNYGKNEYVRNLFAQSVHNEVIEFQPVIRNYFRGHYIDHPAQSNLYQVPEPLRTQCLNSFLEARSNGYGMIPRTYQEWINAAFGRVFAETFPAAYTRKYWTTEPSNLGTDWLEFVAEDLPRRGRQENRVYYPTVEDVRAGYSGRLDRNTFYAATFRYPAHGGFVSFLRKLANGANIQYGKRLTRINFKKRELGFSDGSEAYYECLVSTIPLPDLIRFSEDAPADVKDAASRLRCTNFLLIEVTAHHPTKRDDHFIYVYDEDKISTRISVTERFSPNNAPPSMTGISVEVYGSPYRPLSGNRDEVARKVQSELVEFGLLESLEVVASVHVRHIPFAQVIFDHDRKPAVDIINSFLDEAKVWRLGRFAEWDYLMTHDCLCGSRQIAEAIKHGGNLADNSSRESAVTIME